MIYCGWCQAKPQGAPVTTGICPRCEAKLLAELEPRQDDVKRLADNQPFEPRGGTFYGQGY